MYAYILMDCTKNRSFAAGGYLVAEDGRSGPGGVKRGAGEGGEEQESYIIRP